MNYESQEHYDYEMSQAGAAEAEAEAAHGYDEYLNQLLNDGQTYLYACEKAIEWLNSTKFKKSGLEPIVFLEQLKADFTKAMNKPATNAQPFDDDDLPF